MSKNDTSKLKKLEENRQKLLDSLPKNKEDFLEKLIQITDNCITGQYSSVDEFFEKQSIKLEKQLDKLKKTKNEPKKEKV